MAEKHAPGDILVLDEVRTGTWTQYQGFIDRLIELGIHFPFDESNRPPQALSDDLSHYRLIAAPLSRQAELEQDPRLARFRSAGGEVTYLRDDPLEFADDCTEPAALDWVSRNAIEHWVTSVRPPLRDPRLEQALCSPDDARVARSLLENANAQNRRYMTYSDFPAVYWYGYMSCAELSSHRECLEVVRQQLRELCEAQTDRATGEFWHGDRGIVRWTQMKSIPSWLYQVTGDDVYRRYAQQVADAFLDSYPRMQSGFFCHHSDWTCGEIDEACGGCLGRAGAVLGRPDYWDLVVRHFVQSYKLLGDAVTGLEYHVGGEWGHNAVMWGRGMGWSLWGLTESIGSVPEGHAGREALLGTLRRYADGLADCQSATGLWHNVLLHPRSDMESSCTAMFVACFARALRLGWLPDEPKYRDMVARGWRGLRSRVWQGWLTGCCTGMAMSMNENYYWQRPFVRAMPFLALWAASEWMALQGIDW